MDKARKTALSALDSVFINNAFSNIALDSAFKANQLSPLDKSFASALFYGVLDRKITLDYELGKYIKKGTDKTEITVLNALRLALYQIMFMDKVPNSAAVNESVNLIKSSKYKYSASFVNAVLRNILRNGTSLPQDDSINSLSIKFSCSEYIIKDLINSLGAANATAFLQDSLLPPPVFIKVNTLKTDKNSLISLLSNEGIKAEECENDAVKILGGIDVTASKCFKEGFFHTEDLACQKAIKCINAKKGERILDMCASPGGKSFAMAEDMENFGEIVSCDLYESRVELINKGAKRLGIDIIKPLVTDSQIISDLGLFDAVLCDVPCSGYGVIRRKPEIKYKEENNFRSLNKTQKTILSNADKYLKSGGRILYSTCTLRKEENGDTVAAFLKEHQNYNLSSEHTFLPHIDGTDGFYCALLIKSR